MSAMTSKLHSPLATFTARFHSSDASSPPTGGGGANSPPRRSLDQQAVPPARRSAPDVQREPEPAHEPQRRRASASSSNDDLAPHVKDALFAFQMQQPNPHSLTPGSFVAAGVCSSPRDAAHVHAALLKAGVLAAQPGATESHHHHAQEQPEYLPATLAITAQLPRQVRTLNVAAVKTLVKTLFFWEEELQRMRAKEADLAQLRSALASLKAQRAGLQGTQDGGDSHSAGQDAPPPPAEPLSDEELVEEKGRLDKMVQEVEFRIRAVMLRTRVAPSQRPIDEDHDELPRYE